MQEGSTYAHVQKTKRTRMIFKQQETQLSQKAVQRPTSVEISQLLHNYTKNCIEVHSRLSKMVNFKAISLSISSL